MKRILIERKNIGSKSYKSIQDAADDLEVARGTVTEWCNGNKKPNRKDIISARWMNPNEPDIEYKQKESLEELIIKLIDTINTHFSFHNV